MTLKDYYQILRVRRDDSSEDIRKAFRRLALRYHPDHNPSNSKEAEEKFKEINDAYEVLGNDQKKRQYDRLINWSGYLRKSIVIEDTFKDSIDQDLIREIMQRFAALNPSFRALGRRRSSSCKRQRGWRCRRQWWQDEDV
jgi:curved DNA-binding protein CbpA